MSTSLPGGHSEWEPPDSIPNSVVKTLSADDSVGLSPCESRTLPGTCTEAPGSPADRGLSFFSGLSFPGERHEDVLPDGVPLSRIGAPQRPRKVGILNERRALHRAVSQCRRPISKEHIAQLVALRIRPRRLCSNGCSPTRFRLPYRRAVLRGAGWPKTPLERSELSIGLTRCLCSSTIRKLCSIS